MINYFTDSRHTSWTVSLYFLVHDGNPSSFGLVDNGDCVENATYLVYGRATASGPAATVYGGIAAGSPRATNTPLQAVSGALVATRRHWSYARASLVEYARLVARACSSSSSSSSSASIVNANIKIMMALSYHSFELNIHVAYTMSATNLE